MEDHNQKSPHQNELDAGQAIIKNQGGFTPHLWKIIVLPKLVRGRGVKIRISYV